MTTGALGFVKFGARKWKQQEINTLEAVAALFAQLQARVTAEERLRYLAKHDDLTGLYNRRALVAYLSDRLAAGSPDRSPSCTWTSTGSSRSTIISAIPRVTGSSGCSRSAFRACAGTQSMIARLGGDEFVVVPGPADVAARPRSRSPAPSAMLRERLAIGSHMITRTVSIGVAVGMPGRDNSTDLLRRADEAVLTAKRGGGNQVAVSTDDMSLKSAFRNDIELHLQGDIDSEALLLHYLPEVDLWTGAMVAAEALVRWRHPIWGLLLPDSFIGVAESTNLAGELGRWVMRSACAEFSRWRANGVGQSAVLRINVSPVQLITRDFVRSVADTIEEFGIDAGSVCLEITERAVVHDIEATRKTLSELKEVGVQIAIDDFGTGYAVLSHLKSLPVDMLKIDAGFVRDLGTNAGDLAIVRAIIGLAEAFGLQVVAEGVETPAAALTLMQHGCHRAQGFLLSRPIPGNAMEALLAARWMPMPFLADREALSSGACNTGSDVWYCWGRTALSVVACAVLALNGCGGHSDPGPLTAMVSPATPPTVQEIRQPAARPVRRPLGTPFPARQSRAAALSGVAASYDASLRISWRQLQPTDPRTLPPDAPDDRKYDFSAIDDALKKLAGRNMRLTLRVYAYSSCCTASYPITRTSPSRTGCGPRQHQPPRAVERSRVTQVVPNWNDPKYLNASGSCSPRSGAATTATSGSAFSSSPGTGTSARTTSPICGTRWARRAPPRQQRREAGLLQPVP